MIIYDLILAVLAIGAAVVLIAGVVQAIRHTGASRALGRGRGGGRHRTSPREGMDRELKRVGETRTDPVVEAAAAQATLAPETAHQSTPIAETAPAEPSRSQRNPEPTRTQRPAPIADRVSPKPPPPKVADRVVSKPGPRPVTPEPEMILEPPDLPDFADAVVSEPPLLRVTPAPAPVDQPAPAAEAVVSEPPPARVTPAPVPVDQPTPAAEAVVSEPPPARVTPAPVPVDHPTPAAEAVVSQSVPMRETPEPVTVPEPAPAADVTPEPGVTPAPTIASEPAPVAERMVPEPVAAPSAPDEPAPASRVQEPEPSLVEECSALYESGRYEALLALAEPHLNRADEDTGSSPSGPDELAALWGLVGLSRQALNEEEAARAAFEQAISVAPEPEQEAYRRQLAELAAGVASRLVTRAETRVGISEEERVRTLTEATTWLQHGLEVMPDDESLTSSLAQAQSGLWAAYGSLSTTLVQRGEFERARRLMREALAEEALPPDRREDIEDLIVSASTGEIGNLTAHAIRIMEEERHAEAPDALQQAEDLLLDIPEHRLAQADREEIRRRLWWGYTKLGLRRMEAGEFETAVGPLLHALKIGVRDAERARQTRVTALQALEGLADAHATAVDHLAGNRKREAAVTKGEQLRAVIDEALAVGLTRDELARPLEAVQQIEHAPGR